MNKKSEIITDNIFADLGLEQSDKLKARAELLHQASSLIKASKLSQKEIAGKLDITQSKVSMLASGRLSAFSIDALLYYLSVIGCDIKVQICKPCSRASIFRRKGRIAVH